MRYQLLILFSVLSLIGLALLPRLPIQLAPSGGGQSLTVSYQWHYSLINAVSVK